MQSVNLYTQEFRPKKVLLPLSHLVLIPFVTLALLLVITHFVEADRAKLEAKANNNEKRLEALQTQVNALEKRSGSLVRDESLVAANERLKKKLKARESMLDVLESVDVDEGEGFSKVLVSLARQRTPELWLTQIEMVGPERGYSLNGITQSAEAVPTFLQNLREEEVFLGHAFNLFSIEASDSSSTSLDFSLRSQGLGQTGAGGPILFSQLLQSAPVVSEKSTSLDDIKGLINDG